MMFVRLTLQNSNGRDIVRDAECREIVKANLQALSFSILRRSLAKCSKDSGK